MTITFSEAVSGFTNADLTVANGSLSAVSSGDGGVTWTATLTPTSSTTQASNVITLDNTGVVDAAGNAGSGSTDSNNYAIDTLVPSVTGTTPVGGAQAADISVNFTVTFNKSVSNLSTDDFALGSTGSASGSIASVSTSAGSSVTVTVNSISGNGTLKLNVNGSTNITDSVGNAAPAAYSSGTAHTVAVPTAPDAPTIGTATAGDTTASVSFTAPANNGGASITGYTVTSNPGGITGTGASSPISVTGLTNGTAYTFTVTATNSAGTGSASSASNSVTPKASQTITFTNPGSQNFGTTPTLTATSTSSLTVSLYIQHHRRLYYYLRWRLNLCDDRHLYHRCRSGGQ